MKIKYKYKGDKEQITTVGETFQDCYITHRTYLKDHYFRKYGGYGISKDVLDGLEKDGIKNILIIYHGAKGIRFFYTELKMWLQSQKRENYTGDDLQIFVSQKDMTYYKNIGDVPETNE